MEETTENQPAARRGQTMPLVSVIIPNYNHARYLTERIGSVLAQDYPNFEVIILDDASTDNSREVINAFSSDPRVVRVVFNEANSGNTFLQWKKGFALARGEYIWIAESDDTAAPTFLSAVMAKILEAGSGVVLGFSGSYLIDSRGDRLEEDWERRVPYPRRSVFEGEKFVRTFLLLRNKLYNASMVVFRRDAIPAVDETYLSLPHCGDWLFWAEVCRQGRVVRVREKLNSFRQHEHKVSVHAKKTGLNNVEPRRVREFLLERVVLSAYDMRVLRGYHRRHKSKDKCPASEVPAHFAQIYQGTLLDVFVYEFDKVTGLSGIKK